MTHKCALCPAMIPVEFKFCLRCSGKKRGYRRKPTSRPRVRVVR